MKFCRTCKLEKPLKDFSAYKLKSGLGYRHSCKSCHNLIEKSRDKSHRISITKEYKRAERFRRVYGISLEDYDSLLQQQAGLCAICLEPQSWNRREGDVLVVDHDHHTGRVRGLLCHACNQTLGLMRDNPELLMAAAKYLMIDNHFLSC